MHTIYKKEFEEGNSGKFEYVRVGDGSASKTKELRKQGIKINGSLSAMGRFFLEMSKRIKKGSLCIWILMPPEAPNPNHNSGGGVY